MGTLLDIIGWVTGPLGSWISAALAALAVAGAVYGKGRLDAAAKIKAAQAAEALRRTQNAVQADNAVRDDIARGGLRNDDGFRRD